MQYTTELYRGLRVRLHVGYLITGTVRETGRAGVLFDLDRFQVDEGCLLYKWGQINSWERI